MAAVESWAMFGAALGSVRARYGRRRAFKLGAAPEPKSRRAVFFFLNHELAAVY
jgi:hypothetical protein